MLSIRPATADDQTAVNALLKDSSLALLDAAAQFGDHYMIATNPDGELIGVAGLEVYGRAALLRSVVVAEGCRSNGIARQLIEERLNWAKANGISALYLLTTDAAEYWKRYGFETIQRSGAPDPILSTSQWSGGCSASATAMRKKLTED